VLGYNEPDSTSQANMTVAQAIADWPNMMQWGLRAGAPAVSDSGVTGQGLDWLYSFMSQANSLGYRVDFIPIHYYKCGWSTGTILKYLAQNLPDDGQSPFGSPNGTNGANWCSSGLPGSQTAEAHRHKRRYCNARKRAVRGTIRDLPMVRPLHLLNLINTNSPYALTPAGVVYANQQSGVALHADRPPGGSRGIAEFQFQNNTLDSSG